jgi:Uncharacterized alpha/beta hydrolase domain (DUF2235)
MDEAKHGQGQRRQLIVCCDGTNNNLTGRRNDTNVTQLCELLAPDKQNQLLYYDPGVGNSGTFPGATWTEWIQQKYERLSSLAFGSGIYENIAEAYRFLMRNWREGDDIFLFGFSRGAFTARSVGGLVTQFGILRPDMEVMLPTLLHLYFLDRDANQAEFTLIKNQVGDLFASDAARKAPVWFVGVWDTVESVGAPLPLMRKKITAKATIVDKRFQHVRQALALDEYRFFFAPRPYWVEQNYDYAAKCQSIVQEWFSGSHCDVGGGYVNTEAGLSAQTLLWMVDQAASPLCKLRLRPALLTDNLPDHRLIAKHLDERSKPRDPLERLVHSAPYSTPWWAIAGLKVRDPVVSMKRIDAAVKLAHPVESPMVAAAALAFPKDTVWRTPRAWGWLLFAAFMYCVFATIAAAFHLGPNPLNAAAVCTLPFASIFSWMNELPPLISANLCFAQWQLAWFANGQSPSTGLIGYHSPNRAVAVDFFITASYGYLLARGAGWAFARRAGLRRVGMKPSKPLQFLGMAPLVAILGDVFENLLTWLTLAVARNSFFPKAEYGVGALMTLASATKWLALLASLALILWGCFAKRDQFNP